MNSELDGHRQLIKKYCFDERVSLFFTTSSLLCFYIISEPGFPRLVVAMVGKFCITASFGLIYVYSVEVFPTPLR